MQKGKGKAPLTPVIIEVSNEDNLFRDNFLDEEIVESTRIKPSGTIVSSRKGGEKAIFKDYELEAQYSIAWDDKYDPRQVFNSTFDRIHTNGDTFQPDSYVACTSNKLRIGDVLQKVVISQYKNSTVNCVNCKEKKSLLIQVLQTPLLMISLTSLHSKS